MKQPSSRSSLPSPLFSACPKPPPEPTLQQKQQQQQQQQQQRQQQLPNGADHLVSHGSAAAAGNSKVSTASGRFYFAAAPTSSSSGGSGNGDSSSSSSSSSSSRSSDNESSAEASTRRRPRRVGVRARALFNFEASGPGELSVTSGQPIRALYHVDRRWLFVLTRLGTVGYIPFLYAAKDGGSACRPVPSMRRYCRGLSPPATSATATMATATATMAQLCLPDDLSRPPAMEDASGGGDGDGVCPSAPAPVRRQAARPSSLRLERRHCAAALAEWHQQQQQQQQQQQSELCGGASRPATTATGQPPPPPPPPPLQPENHWQLLAERPRRSSFDSAVAASNSAAAASSSGGKRRVTFRADAEVIGVADNIDRQPVYNQTASAAAGHVRRQQSQIYFGQAQLSSVSSTDSSIHCVLQTLV